MLADSVPLYIIGIVTALLTAYYMTRQVIMVFFGEARWEDKSEENGAHGDLKPHESPATMTIPLIVLAGLAVFGGLIQLPGFGWLPERSQHQLEHWTEPVIEFAEAGIEGSWALAHQELLIAIAVASGLIGIALAWLVYQRKRIKAVEPEILEEAWRYDATVAASWAAPAARRSRRSPGSTRTSSTAP